MFYRIRAAPQPQIKITTNAAFQNLDNQIKGEGYIYSLTDYNLMTTRRVSFEILNRCARLCVCVFGWVARLARLVIGMIGIMSLATDEVIVGHW